MRRFCVTIFILALTSSTYLSASELSHDILVERGMIVSQGRQGVSTRIRGIIEKLTPSGTLVKEGDFLFKLDTSALQIRHDEMREALDRQVQEIEEKKDSMREKEDLYTLKEKWLKAKVEHHQLEYNLAIRPLLKDEERIASIPIEITKLKLDEAQEGLDRQNRLIEAGFASPSSLTPKELRLNSLRLQLLKDQQSLELLRKGTSLEERLELEVKLKAARGEMNRQQAEHNHEMKVLASQLKELEVKYEHEKVQLEVVTENLKYTDARAAKDGVWVLKKYRDWWRGGVWRDMHLGKSVSEYQVLGDLIDPNVLSIQIKLHESDRKKIKLDQRCSLRFPALSGQRVDGRLSSISKIAKDRLDLSENGEEVELSHYGLFEVYITPEVLLPDLKPGMSAIVTIPISEDT
jgi:multidrug resistance efflux pump